MIYATLKTIHVFSIVLWIGGMAFAHFFLRPAVAQLEASVRLRLMHDVLGRFFQAVLVASLLTLASGVWMLGRVAKQVVQSGGRFDMPTSWTLIAVLGVAMVAIFLPLDRSEVRSSPLGELRAFNRAPIWLALGIGSIGFAGMFCVFSYMAPTLLEVTRVSAGWIPLAMGVFGAGCIVGNSAGGWLFDRLRLRAVAWILAWSTLVLLAFPYAAHSLWTLLPAIFALGTMIALGPALQTHLMDVAADAQTLAAASNHAAFNIANALGPWLGGLAITAGFGWTSTGYIGAATAVGGLLVFAWAWKIERAVQDADAGQATCCS